MPEFYNLLDENQNNTIELDEDRIKNNPNYKKKVKLIKLTKINNEINYVNSLIDSCEEKILFYRGKKQNTNKNYDNNVNIKNVSINNNNFEKNKSINLLAVSHESIKTQEPTIDEIINILKQKNFCFNNKNSDKFELRFDLKYIKEKNEKLSANKNNENINITFKEEYVTLFNKDNNYNDINFKPLKNKNFNFNSAKDYLFSDISIFGDIDDFNYNEEKLFE